VDALHLACAEAIGADFFITCDDKLMKRYSGSLKVKNPVEFATTLINSLEEEAENENS
jgi:predicted nucleic acid-binding protein